MLNDRSDQNRDKAVSTAGSTRVNRRQLLTSAGALAVGLTQFDHALAAGSYAQHRLVRNQEAGGTAVYGLGFDLDGTMDPQVTHFDSTIRVTLNVCEPLLWMPTATEFYPALAESWDISADGLEYTFHLKEGVIFHDGTPFNAEAVQFTFDRIVEADKLTETAVAAGTPADQVEPADPTTVIVAGQAHDQIGPYDHSEIIDDLTIKIVLSRAFTPFLSGLNGYVGIVSPTAVQTMGLAEFARKPVGTGPYKVEEWVEADHVTLVRNEDYTWGSPSFANPGQGLLERIEYRIVGDRATRTLALTSGEMHYIDDFDPLQKEDLEGNTDLTVIRQGQPGSGWTLHFNMLDRPDSPQNDIVVRQALSFAVDKAAFNESVFGGTNDPAASPLMKPTLGYEQATEAIYTFDLAKAEELLEGAGWVKNGDVREKDGKKLSFYFPIIDRENDKNMATFLQAAFTAVGAEVEVEARERGAATENRLAGNYDLIFLWFSYADPDILRAMYHTDNIGGFNFPRISDPELDAWLVDAAASQDVEERVSLYSQIQLKVINEAITIPLADSITYNAKRANLQGEILDYLASYVWMNSADFTA